MQEKRRTEKQCHHQEKRYERRNYSLRRRSKPLETFWRHSLRPFKLWTRDPEQRMKSGVIHIPQTNGASSQEKKESISRNDICASGKQDNRTLQRGSYLLCRDSRALLSVLTSFPFLG